MSQIELTEALLAKLAGWEAVKSARSMLAGDRVLSSEWLPPLLRGTVMEGPASIRTGLMIKGPMEAENICPCRDSRQRGLICAHVVAVGLHFLKAANEAKFEKVAVPKNVAPEVLRKSSGKKILRSGDDASAELLELCVIFPPNFAEAIIRNKVMLYFDGKWSRGRMPLGSLPMDQPFALSGQEAKFLDAIEGLGDGNTPAMLSLTGQELSGLLPLLAAHPRVTLGKNQPIAVSSNPIKFAIRADLEKNGEIVLTLLGELPAKAVSPSVNWIFQNGTLRPISLPTGVASILDKPFRITRSHVPQFLNLEWPKLLASCEVEANFSMEDFELANAIPKFSLHLAGGLAMLEATLICHYGESKFNPASAAMDGELWLPDAQLPTRYLTRNFSTEREAILRLSRAGFTGPDSQNHFHLKDQNQILNFFAGEFPRLERDWQVTLEERLERSTEKNLERINPRFEIRSSGEEWFNLNVEYDTRTGDHFSAADIQRLLLSGQSHTKLKSGKFALLDTGAVEELKQVLVDCAPEQKDGSFRLNNFQSGFLAATLQAQPQWRVNASAIWKERAARKTGEVKLPPISLGKLDSVLRPYQKEGVAWLSFLRANGFGGILADEMGLGKTLQVLALLNSISSTDRKSPFLVICPTSLVYNWAAEARKFVPDLRVLSLHGPKRQELLKQIPASDLIITSYSVLRRDAEHYREMEFDTVVLDEAQHIKNRQTQNAQSVKAIRSRNRLVLTGTPIENSVLDLWSIFDFLMPGYLGAATDFKERYEVAIARDRDAKAQERLSRRVRPFMLRRLKKDVAKDLPAKIEQVSYCELNDEQRALYQQILDASRREILATDESKGIAKSRMLVLTTLLRLRQVCCDLRLLNIKADNRSELTSDQDLMKTGSASGKVELFLELLSEVIDGGHRVLVFSQFTSMLGLLKAELSAQQINFCYLDGSTIDRAAIVEKFQNDKSIPVFLISLKAGGVGLNLTGADTVIHFDPWWNPAVEAQATDRAHRIGQQKIVTSYKMITRGTVEEKILNLQNRKRSVIQGVLGDEEALVDSLSWEEIQELLTS